MTSNPSHDDKDSAERSSRGARIGHVNLKVAELERSLAFYEGVLGLKITKRIGDQAAFLAFGDNHHDICINT
jgi:catechol 2,3-dioxygenase